MRDRAKRPWVAQRGGPALYDEAFHLLSPRQDVHHPLTERPCDLCATIGRIPGSDLISNHTAIYYEKLTTCATGGL